jgi:hypothetical protein
MLALAAEIDEITDDRLRRLAIYIANEVASRIK